MSSLFKKGALIVLGIVAGAAATKVGVDYYKKHNDEGCYSTDDPELWYESVGNETNEDEIGI